MTQADHLARRPELAELWRRVRRQVEQRGVTGQVKVPLEEEAQARAVSQLLARSRPWLPGDVAVVRLAQLDDALQHVGGLVTVLSSVAPLVDRRAEREQRAAAVETLWAELAASPAGQRAEVRAWLDAQRAGGRWHGAAADLEASRQVLRACLTVADVLPAPREVGLTKLAADVLGEPHALDDDDAHPAGRAILGLLEAIGDPADLTGAARRRALWAAVNVRVGALEPVRCLGLTPIGHGLLARQLRERSEAGWPQLITAVELDAVPLVIAGRVFCCENREVYEAALRELGPRCPQLVCIDGWPSVTVSRVLRGLAPGQAIHHGDFDWGGWRIARHLRVGHGVGSWRYDAAAFRALRARRPDAGTRLKGSAPAPDERDALADALVADGRGLSEELDLELLIEDLRMAAESPRR